MKVVFIDIDDAGPAQLAAALAKEERDERGVDIEVRSGGIAPRGDVREAFVEASQMTDMGISYRQPRQIDPEDLRDATIIVTIGDSFDHVFPENWTGEHQIWELENLPPDGQLTEVRDRVTDILDNIGGEPEGRSP